MNGLNLFKSVYTQILKYCKNTDLAMTYSCDLILQLQDSGYNVGRIANIKIDESYDYSRVCHLVIRYNGRDEWIETCLCKNRVTEALGCKNSARNERW